MGITIGVINPITTREFEIGTCREAKHYAMPGVDIIVETVEKGPASIECRYDEVCAAVGVLEKIKQMEGRIDAAVVNCFGDPGVESAREIVKIPVVGPGSASMLLASLIGEKYSVITVLKRLQGPLHTIAQGAGAWPKLASVRAVELPVLELEKDPDALVEALVENAKDAVEKDDAHVIVLGCTGMAGLADAVRKNLLKTGYDVPILDPFAVAVKQATILAQLGLAHSKLDYPEPPEKHRKW